MRVVVDTNVLVSAALRDRDPEAVILFIVARPDFEWVVSSEILAEYKDVLARPKFNLPEEILSRWDKMLGSAITHVEPEETLALKFPRDQKDAKFLACALAADADFFVTGDRDFSEAQKLVNTVILSISRFKELWIDSSEAEGDESS